ncbi:hypothetical protein D3C71_1973390 [compost metagenome]
MGHQHRILLFQLGGNLGSVESLLLGRQRLGLLGVQMGLDQQAFGNLRHVIRPCTGRSAGIRVYPPV